MGMVGETRAKALEEIQPGREHRAFYHLSIPKKLVVMTRGILVNLVLGTVLLVVVVGIVGIPGRTMTLSTVALCVSSDIDASTPCQDSDSVGSASVAGMRAGDRIVPWGGMKVSTWEEL